MSVEIHSLPQRDYLEMALPLAGLRLERGRKPRFLVAFRLSLLNRSGGSICLKGRKWTLQDSMGNTRIIEASQVFNQQPILSPGAVFSYGGCQEFSNPPKAMQLRFFGSDQHGQAFISPPLIFPASCFRLPR